MYGRKTFSNIVTYFSMLKQGCRTASSLVDEWRGSQSQELEEFNSTEQKNEKLRTK